MIEPPMSRPSARPRRGVGPLAAMAAAVLSLVACGPRTDRAPAVIPARPATGAIATDQSVPGPTAVHQGTSVPGDNATDAHLPAVTTMPVATGPSGPRTIPTVDAAVGAASEDLDQVLKDIDRTLAAADATERSAEANGE